MRDKREKVDCNEGDKLEDIVHDVEKTLWITPKYWIA